MIAIMTTQKPKSKLKLDIDIWSIIVGVSTCCILCGATLFVYSYRFVNVEITPKWMGLLLSIGIVGIACGVFCRRVYLPVKSIFLFLMCCFLLVFVRDWTTSGINPPLLIYLGGLLLLFFVAQQIVVKCPSQFFFGTIIVFALALSLHGILQYTGVIQHGRNNFTVTGNFDNPAGFSTALVCVFPFCFLFFKQKMKSLRYAAMMAAGLMAFAVFLSGSRAGIMAVAASITVGCLCNQNSSVVYPEV